MRTLLVVATVVLCSPFAGARERRTNHAPSLSPVKKLDPRLAVVDDEPMSERALTPAVADTSDEVGSRKALRVEAPVFAPIRAVADESAIEAHGVRAVAARPEEASVSGAIDLIAQKQMRKHQAAIDTCTAAAVKRNARATGTLELSILIGDKKVAYADVSEDPIHDAELNACLLKAAEAWTFSLAHTHFTWQISLSPSASR